MARVTVLIPTAGRPTLLEHTLNGLISQSFRDFEVLLVLKSADSESLAVAERFAKLLKIRVHFQRRSGLLEAYSEGIAQSSGDITVFLDDDAIPEPNFLLEHILSYEKRDVSGVSGEVVPVFLKNNAFLERVSNPSEILGFYHEPVMLRGLGAKFWNCPLRGQEDFLAYISRAGYAQKNIYLDRRLEANSLLCMAANMSVRKSALEDFILTKSFLKRGISFEQVVGWHLWKKGHRTIFNPRAMVFHVLHGETMSRSLERGKTSIAVAEDELVFYYLFSLEKQLSIMHHIVSLTHRLSVHGSKLGKNWRLELPLLRGIVFGNLIGVTWLVSKRVHGAFLPIQTKFFR